MTGRRLPLGTALLCATLVFALVALVQTPALASGRGKPRVTVAVIDSPPNPYHNYLYKGSPIYKHKAPSSVTPAVLKEFGIKKDHIIKVTRTGRFEKDFNKDKQLFKRIEPGEPYWFKGTNIIGISFMPKGEGLRPDQGSSHGVGTGSAVLSANPDAVVVMVDAPGSLAVPPQPGFGTTPAGEKWAFNHPAIDIVSTSYGPPGSPPFMYHLTDSYVGVVKKGKLHFGASDNSPALAPVDATAGPWWSVGVAGYQEGEGNGRTVISGTFPDFVADFTQLLPDCLACEKGMSRRSGTSFSTPFSAGLASHILLEARRAASHRRGVLTKGVKTPVMVEDGKASLTNWEIRRALEEAAYYPSFSEYDSEESGVPPLGVPITEEAPWAQIGWGILSGKPRMEIAKEALAQLGVRGKAKRSKAGAPCDFMTANMEVRRHYWNNAIHSQSNGTDKYPYVSC